MSGYLTTDFNKANLNVFCDLFGKNNVIGCYFHILHALWWRDSKLGLGMKSQILITKELILNLKLLPFTYFENIADWIDYISDYFSKLDSTLTCFLKYF